MRHIMSVLVLLVLVAGAYGTTFYVSTSGSDSNPGTQALPWRTLQKAVDTIGNGDTAIVLSGTYVGCRMRYSGAAGAPKTIKAESAGAVVINAPGPNNYRTSNMEIIHDDHSSLVDYWVVENFTVTAAPAWGIDCINADHALIRNNTAYDNGESTGRTGIHVAHSDYALVESNTSYSNGEHGVYCCNSADGGVIRANRCYGNVSMGFHMNGDSQQPGDGIMSNWLIEKNMSYNNGTNGFDADGVETSTWKNNLGYGNVSKGIHLTAVNGSCNPRYDNILNNTFISKVGAYYCVNFYKARNKAGGNNNTVKNNILYHYEITNSMRGSLMYISGWISTLQSDYNTVVDRFAVDDNKKKYTLAQWRATYGQDMHSTLCLDVNALFVDPAADNWHLKAGSPAANAGTTLTAVTDDLEGEARPQGTAYDCGCYEDF